MGRVPLSSRTLAAPLVCRWSRWGWEPDGSGTPATGSACGAAWNDSESGSELAAHRQETKPERKGLVKGALQRGLEVGVKRSAALRCPAGAENAEGWRAGGWLVPSPCDSARGARSQGTDER